MEKLKQLKTGDRVKLLKIPEFTKSYLKEKFGIEVGAEGVLHIMGYTNEKPVISTEFDVAKGEKFAFLCKDWNEFSEWYSLIK